MTLVFSLVGGLAIALIIQLLLISLSIALGLTILDLSPKALSPKVKSLNEADIKTSDSSKASFSWPVTHLLGFGIAIGVSSIIFITAFVSTDFSAIVQPRRGVIYGLIYWAVYWTLLVWLSTTTIAGAVDFLFGGAIASIKQVLSAFRGSSDSENSNEDSILQSLSGELSQIIDSQQALPALLATQRETLVKEISDRTQLSPTQTSSLLTNISPKKPEEGPEKGPETSPTAHTTINSATSSPTSLLISQIESALDLPSWQQLSQRVIDQVDFSDIEALASHLPALLQEKGTTFSQPAQAELEKNEAIAKASSNSVRNSSPKTLEESEEQTAIAQEIQKRLISYCRYTNVDLLTPDNMTAKIDTQAAEHSIELDHLQIDITAVEDVLSKRQNLSEEKKQAIVGVLESIWHQEKSSDSKETEKKETEKEETEKSYPKKIQQALESSVESIEWQEVIAPSLNEAGSWIDQMKVRIAHYLQKQDKLAFHPVQMAKDLTQIVGKGLGALPSPSDLPNLAELETLWDKSSWQLALEERKDLTVDEIQEILDWSETAWQPVVKQTSTWLQSLQSQADQLRSLVDSTSLDTAREKIVGQIEQAKATLDQRADAMKREIQVQADAARKQGVIAAWWLFISLLSSGMAAGGAGWIATRY